MARKAGADLIYELAQLFRKRCLESSESFLWLDTPAWTADSMQKLWRAFMDNPDVSKRGFYDKWEDQLAGESEDVHRIAADLTAFYYLFPHDIGKEQKLERVGRVISWKLSSAKPDLAVIKRAYDEDIGSTGRMYFSRIPEQIAFFLAFAQAIRAGKANSNDAQASKRLADEISKGIKASQAGRNVLLHLLFPDVFERIASQSHKLEIAEYFADLAEGATDVDEALKKIRDTLANGDPNFDFYQADIKKRWHDESRAATARDEEETEESSNSRPACWVEKTIVRGRVDRQEGEYAVGRALWCPKVSKGSADIYRFIRSLKAGDIILHLTDNDAFTRISRVSESCEEFNGVADTKWGLGPSYIARLRDAVELNPALSREAFFSAQYRERLISIIDGGAKNLFYDRNLDLNQGAYLTPAPPEVIGILNDAYIDNGGVSLGALVPELKAILDSGISRKKWIFQGNPVYYDLRGAIRSLQEQSWLVQRFKDEIKLGDKVYIWESGSDGGIIGVAEVVGAPKFQPAPIEELPFIRKAERFDGNQLRATLKIVKAIEPPISRKRLLSHRELIGLSIVKQPQGTNFRVTEEEAKVIEEIIGTPTTPASTTAPTLADLEDATNLSIPELEEIEALIRAKGQLIFEGPPGSGKTFIAELFARYFAGQALDGPGGENLRTVQFHQSYSYEDFIQGIRPETNTAGQLEYRVKPGVFKEFCDKARKTGKQSVFVIDEINRGNISRILGELLFLLEYRDREILLPYDQEAFSIPSNVYVIGTMNTTDRSLAQIDYALRRRFYFYRLQPVQDGRASALEKQLKKLEITPEAQQRVLRLFINLNGKIQEKLGEHFQVGHSHFMIDDIGSEHVLQQVWNRSIVPLLEEYFYNSRDRTSVLSEYTIEKLLNDGAQQIPSA